MTPVYAKVFPPSPIALSPALFPEAPPSAAIRAALWLRRALGRALDALFPAEIALFEKTTGLCVTMMLGAIAERGIVDHLGDERLTADALAKRAHVDPDLLHRTLRALATRNVFVLHEDGTFENNRQSRLLAQGRLNRLREWSMYMATGSNVAAWADFGETLATGKSAFDRVHGMTVWDWFAKHPDEEALFGHVMMGLTTQEAAILAKLYPFAEVRTLCDVGGGRGTLLSELLLRHPHLEGALAEGEGVLRLAKELLTARGVMGRAKLVQASFFENVPEGYDAYLMKNILHDWDDETCVKILSNVKRAMKPGAKLIVCETILEKNELHPFAAGADVHMIVACSGRERSEGDFRALFERAGLRMGRVFPYPTTSILEVLRG